MTRLVSPALPAFVLLGSLFSVPDLAVGQPPSTGFATVRPRINLTPMVNRTKVIPAHLITPAMAQNIGPGSHLLITIPGAGTFGCTANFVWADGDARYLGAAGHCFVPEGLTSTHGPDADFDASGVVVRVCVSDCSFGGETGFTLTGNLVQLESVAYARQTVAGEDIGNDFGVVEIPPAFAASIAAFWMGDLAAAPGDSGSAVVTCDSDGTGFHGRGAAGVLTHLSVQVCPCDAGTLTFQQGVVFGTTTARAIEMAREAGLALSVVLP